ncbi:MAG: DNA-3-methyladenine glycosylase 2 family protein [Rhodobacteraceae bacterium]|nr:MAG: DNA-3-methyladenine glycosylase 2 family protein [Paracoccaceae bacterium]
MRRIENAEDIAEGLAWLRAREPRFAEAEAVVAAVPLRRWPDGYGALLRIVAGQQLSVAAADSVWRRLEAAGADTAEGVDALSDAALRACGLSAAKARCARALARAEIDFDALRHADDAAVAARLTAAPGVGPWTASIYMMFCHGRADVFAPGDLALQEAARRLFALDARPSPPRLAALAEAWSPWRAVAARLLWAYYGAIKGREGAAR